MEDSLIHNLREILLDASKKVGQKLFDDLAETLLKLPHCGMCSLWGINNNSTQENETDEKDIFQSISIIARKSKEECDFKKFVLKLKETFIQKTIDNNGIYFIGDRSEHKDKDCIEKLGLKYFIGIPVPDFEDSTKIIAVLKLSYTEDPKIEQLQLFANIIRDYISISLYRYMLLKKQRVMEKLIKNYQDRGHKKIADMFYPILHNILKEYFPAEGSSVFIWDSYNCCYNFICTTAEKILNSEGNEVTDYSEVFYLAGEGLTGKVAAEGKAKIYDDLDQMERNKDTEYKHKFREKTTHLGKTMLVVPILRPSNSKEVIGIIRFVNKINTKGNEVDYFNDADVELIVYVSSYLALNIDSFLEEEDRSNFISKLSHESNSSAIAIQGTADRIKRKMGDPIFMTYSFNGYLESIINSANLQIQQISTNLFLSKNNQNTPKSKKYNVHKYSLLHIIKQSKETVIPLARDANLSFDNIKILSYNIPTWELFIDESAFRVIFHNLLTNAIKYHNSQTEFSVIITGRDTEEYLFIEVSDNGLGILEKDVKKIFLYGFRGEDVSQHNVTGHGIGLYVIKQIIEDFGGKIRVSNLKSPTKFEIKLPKYLLNDNYTRQQNGNNKENFMDRR
jgi:signal transduction histidine kinase